LLSQGYAADQQICNKLSQDSRRQQALPRRTIAAKRRRADNGQILPFPL